VLTPITLDDQFLTTYEISNIRSERHLPYKLVSVEVTPPQFAPQSKFRIGLIKPKFARKCRCAFPSLGRIDCQRRLAQLYNPRREGPLTRPPLRSATLSPLGRGGRQIPRQHSDIEVWSERPTNLLSPTGRAWPSEAEAGRGGTVLRATPLPHVVGARKDWSLNPHSCALPSSHPALARRFPETPAFRGRRAGERAATWTRSHR
jgi:hypothetical protein